MRLPIVLSSCVLALAIPALTARTEAREVVPAEKRIFPYDTLIPPCHDPAVLEKIASRFAEKEWKFWQSALTIVQYDRIRPVAWRPWGLDLIPRRFCTGFVTVSSGTRHRIDYSVREDLGVVGVTWGVEWCVVGLDRNWAYAPACQMARP